MPSRTTVQWLTLCWLLAAILVADLVYFAVGGGDGVRVRQAPAGLLTVHVPAGPHFRPPAAVLPADDGTGRAPTPEGLRTVLGPLLADPGLGGAPAVSVVDAESGEVLYGRDEEQPVTPASVTKVVTATAVLAAFGPYHRFSTRVVAGGQPGEVVLVGGGDPTLALGADGSYPRAARLDLLAAAVRKALGGTAVTRVVVDASLFTGPDLRPDWDGDAVSGGFVAPVNALTVDGGRLEPGSTQPAARTSQPDLFAGRAFAALLDAPGAAVEAGVAPDDAKPLATLVSPPLLHLVELMLQRSDNVIAESLMRQVAVARRQPASFDGASAAVREVLAGLGRELTAEQVVDGSGLSRQNRLTADLLTDLLTLAAAPGQPRLRGVLSGLPVAAFSGTLDGRFGADGGRGGVGAVRAKTGTLTGVSALSGVVLSTGGRLLAFAVIANGVPTRVAAEAALDRVASALARCGCR